MTICANCVSGHVLPGQPVGSTNPSDGSYLALRNPAVAPLNKTAIVLLTDVFGLGLRNSKLLADQFASRLGYDVYVPDLFDGM